MALISPHFARAEFGDVPPHLWGNLAILADALEVVRAETGEPIRITSGYRSITDNRRAGGASMSSHIIALAADFTCGRIASFTLAQMTRTALGRAGIEYDQIIWYKKDRHVHLGMDSRSRLQFFQGDQV